MGIFGDIADIGKGIVHGVEHVASGAAHALAHEAHQALLLGEGVVSGAIIKPIDGVEQLVNKVTGAQLPMLQLPNQDEVDGSWAGKIGEVAGTVASFVYTSGAVSAISGLEATSAGALAITGAVQGGVLSPSDDSKSGFGFLLDRFENAGIDAATYGTMGGVGSKVAGWVTDAEQAALHPIVAAGLPTAVGGAASGVINAEAESLLKQGKFASTDQLLSTIGNYAIFGAAVGAAGHGASAISDYFKGWQPSDAASQGAGEITDGLKSIEPDAIANNALDQDAVRGELTKVLDGRGSPAERSVGQGIGNVNKTRETVDEARTILGDFGINV
jgi:hypothetical protein